ncbi:MAG TPA: biotin/lipoyl-containing protein, partial [Stellaceae bacterium]|nr:biotin/lipoyl-containing protein [Stellaceae bacterium]
MAQAVDVVVEKESANDADGTVVEVFFASGTSVTAGQRIFDIETSKAVQEIYAAVTGVLVHALKPGDTVMLGGAIAQIVSGDSAAAAEPPRPQQAAAATAPTRAVAVRESLPRLSREAAALASQYGLAAADFDRDLVTVADVRRHLNLVPPSPAPAAPTPTPITVAPVARAAAPPPAGDPVPRHKREEIEFLSRGAGAS